MVVKFSLMMLFAMTMATFTIAASNLPPPPRIGAALVATID